MLNTSSKADIGAIAAKAHFVRTERFGFCSIMSDNHSTLSADVDRYLRFWSLQLITHLATSRMGWVGLVRQSGGEHAVLKVVSVTGQREEGTAAAVLQAFDGRGVVRVLRADSGALLLEYCEGPMLLDTPGGQQDHIAVPILCDVVRRMREVNAARPTAVATLADRCWALRKFSTTSLASEDAKLIDIARHVSGDLLQSDTASLLHGDLHHENVMRTRRQGQSIWVAIDPQGLWGDPAYEVANLFGNPLGHPSVTEDPGRPARLADELTSRLGLSPSRVLRWAFVHSCIAAARIAVQQKRHHHPRVKRRLPEAACVAAHDLLQIKALPHQINDKTRDMAFRHEILHAWWKQQSLIDIPGTKIFAHSQRLNQTRYELNSHYSDRLLDHCSLRLSTCRSFVNSVLPT